MRTRFIFAAFNIRDSHALTDHPVLKDSEFVFSDENAVFVVNERYKTGIPQRIVWEGRLGIVLHGIVFPKRCSLDDFAANPDPVLKSILAKHQDDPYNIPYEFINGSYVGFVVDRNRGCFYAFTNFLNSIPLYYCKYKNELFLSTDYNKLAKLCKVNLSGVSNGLLEYYHLGVNLFCHSGLPEVFSVPKGGYLKFDGRSIIVDFYYKFPSYTSSMTFDEALCSFVDRWHANLKALNSNNFKFGLGFTGGIDSRIIFAGWPNPESLITFTGGQPKHPDYILAHHIAEYLHLEKNHYLEDYRGIDKLWSYVENLLYTDNPLLLNSATLIDQHRFREKMGFTYQLMGFSEYIGGVYYYTSRSSVNGVVRMALPLRFNVLANKGFSDYYKLVRLGVRNHVFDEILDYDESTGFMNYLYDSILKINNQINSFQYVETYLERFRQLYKFNEMIVWSSLGIRNYSELIAPPMNIELTDFASVLPLQIRKDRRLLLAYLKRFSPEFSRFVLTGSIFNPNAPHILHKMFNPFVKSINALGYKVPVMQWYIQKSKMVPGLEKTEKLKSFQQSVCENSPFLKDTLFGPLYQQYKNHPKRRWRLFNIALLERRINLNDFDYRVFLTENYERAK